MGNTKTTIISQAGENFLQFLDLNKVLTKDDDDILWELVVRTYWKSVNIEDFDRADLLISVVHVKKWDESFISQFVDIIEEWKIIKEEDSLLHSYKFNWLKHLKEDYEKRTSLPFNEKPTSFPFDEPAANPPKKSKIVISRGMNEIVISRPSKNENKVFVSHVFHGGIETKWIKNAEGFWCPQPEPDVEIWS